MNGPRETELKLEVDPARLTASSRRLQAALGLGEPQPETLVSTYFDTAKFGLHRRGLALRVRHEADGRRVQTLKAAAGRDGALFDRAEWECEIEGDAPDPSLFPDPDATKLLRLKSALLPVFETRIVRTSWTLRKGGSEIELSIDDGSVSARGLSRPIAEIELELKAGNPADLFALARRIVALVRAHPEVRTKSERGYDILAAAPALSFKATMTPLRRGMKAGEAFQAIARNCLAQLLRNRTLVVGSRSETALHQARVGLRRLRSALSLFAKVVADDEVDRLRRGLRGASVLLGRARNLDVYRARVVRSEADRDPGEPGLAEFAGLIEREREAAYDKVVARLESRAFRLLITDVAAWVETGPWLSGVSARGRDEKAWRFARKALRKQRRRVRRSARDLNRLDVPSRHEVRIKAKKLRYAAEFFSGLVRGRKAKRRHAAFVAALERMQASLGDLNDIHTGHDLALNLAEAARADVLLTEEPLALFAAGHASGGQDSREADLLAVSLRDYTTFADAEPFWK